MIEATARIDRARRLDAPVEAAWAFLEDIPAWAALFPHVAAVEPVPEAEGVVYRWTMEPLGPPGRKMTTVYVCRYHLDEAARTLTWEPVEGMEATGQFTGACTLSAAPDGGTDGTLAIDAELRIPAPGFLRGVVAPLVQFEMTRLTDLFLERLDGAIPV